MTDAIAGCPGGESISGPGERAVQPAPSLRDDPQWGAAQQVYAAMIEAGNGRKPPGQILPHRKPIETIFLPGDPHWSNEQIVAAGELFLGGGSELPVSRVTPLGSPAAQAPTVRPGATIIMETNV